MSVQTYFAIFPPPMSLDLSPLNLKGWLKPTRLDLATMLSRLMTAVGFWSSSTITVCSVGSDTLAGSASSSTTNRKTYWPFGSGLSFLIASAESAAPPGISWFN